MNQEEPEHLAHLDTVPVDNSIDELKKHYPDLYAIKEYIPVRLSIRIFDFVAALFLTILSLPLWAVIFLVYLIESLLDKSARGPLFLSYHSRSHGKVFSKRKFRIFKMHHIDMDKLRQHDYQALPNEDTLERKGFTFLGYFLKQTFLDELPQVLSILTGDISIIGPRAVAVEVDKQLREKGFLFHLLKAGLLSDKHARKGSAEYDKTYLLYDYIRLYINAPWYQLLWRNLSILARGITISLQRKGRYTRTGE